MAAEDEQLVQMTMVLTQEKAEFGRHYSEVCLGYYVHLKCLAESYQHCCLLGEYLVGRYCVATAAYLQVTSPAVYQSETSGEAMPCVATHRRCEEKEAVVVTVLLHH